MNCSAVNRERRSVRLLQIGWDCPEEGVAFYQTCIKTVLIKHRSLWAQTMRSGRKRFVDTLDENDHDVFEAAGLMEDPPQPCT